MNNKLKSTIDHAGIATLQQMKRQWRGFDVVNTVEETNGSVRIRYKNNYHAIYVLLTESTVGESTAKYRAALASASRLDAEVGQRELAFPAELDAFPELTASETELYNSRGDSLRQSLTLIDQALGIIDKELTISQELGQIGAASRAEILRLQRQKVDLELKRANLQSDYTVRAREELAKANAEVKPDVFYYRVYVRTDSDALVNPAGKRFPIVPGMVAVVDVHTGSKTVLEYLIKPLNRAQEALRER